MAKNGRALTRRPRRNSSKDWGVYTYIAGDNDLSDYGLVDIQEMEDAGASRYVHVAVQIDTTGEHTGSVRYEISEPDFSGESHRVVIQRLAEQNTGDPKYLTQFAQWAGDRYPARKRLLVVWNHGAGFMHDVTRDIAYDDSSRGDALTMGELRMALERAGFGRGPRGRLEILGFDACLMNMLEVAYEFTGIANLIVGSQQVEPGDGWPYSAVVAGTKNGASGLRVASTIVNEYIKHYRSVGELNVTQSALDLRRLAAVGTAVDNLAAVLDARLSTARSKLLEARVVTQGYEEPTYIDLVDLTRNLSAKVPGAAVKEACRAVAEAAAAAVVANGSYGSSVRRSSGLSIWFPLLKTDYVTRRGEYIALRYTATYPRWSRFLDRLLAE